MSKKPCPVNHAGFIVPTVLLPTSIVIGQGAEAQTIVVYVTSEAMCTFPECGQVFYFSKPKAVQEAQKRGESSVPSTIIPPPASMPVPDPNCAICEFVKNNLDIPQSTQDEIMRSGGVIPANREHAENGTSGEQLNG